jgi:ElaB/YqjD/DUF883 family membrane-anchored ribosome-binding protein
MVYQSAMRSQLQNARDLAEDSLARAGEAAARLQAETDNLVRYLAKNGPGMVSATNDRLQQFGVQPDALAGMASREATRLQKLVVAQVSRHPFLALGAIAAAGICIGLAFARRQEEEVQAPAVLRGRRGG